MKHLDMKKACGKQPQSTFALLFFKTSVTMTNVIVIPEKQIIFIQPESSAISMSFTVLLLPDPFGMVSEKPLFTSSS